MNAHVILNDIINQFENLKTNTFHNHFAFNIIHYKVKSNIFMI